MRFGTVAAGLVVLTTSGGVALTGHPQAARRAATGHGLVAASPLPTTSPAPVAAEAASQPARLPFLGPDVPGTGTEAAPPRSGPRVLVPSVSLSVAVTDYGDCSGNTPMTRRTAVHFLCTPADVVALVGHNPGVFTPLTRTHVGDRVYYQHDGSVEGFQITSIQRVSPQEADADVEDGSYYHAVLATCAEPDSSAYWVLIASPLGSATPATGSPGGGGGGTGSSGSGPSPSPTPAAPPPGPPAPLPVPVPSPPPIP